VLPSERALGTVRNRSAVVKLLMAAVVTGAPACELVPEIHPPPPRISLYFRKRAARGRWNHGGCDEQLGEAFIHGEHALHIARWLAERHHEQQARAADRLA
jgi:hypothetical protein